MCKCDSSIKTMFCMRGDCVPPKVGRGSPLSVSVADGVLSISIGVDVLAHAISVGRRYGSPFDLIVTDPDAFAKEVALELQSEEEDGTTRVHMLLDEVALSVAENGGEGIDIMDGDDDGIA